MTDINNHDHDSASQDQIIAHVDGLLTARRERRQRDDPVAFDRRAQNPHKSHDMDDLDLALDADKNVQMHKKTN